MPELQIRDVFALNLSSSVQNAEESIVFEGMSKPAFARP